MAGFQAGQIDQVSPSVTPLDYSFLNYALSTKESQYERGLSQVKSIYSSVLNSPLTNADNQKTREEYIADAQSGMKELSKADLSLPQNINKAGQLFAPFYQDSDIMADMYTTKGVSNNAAQINQWKTSSDKDEYAKYNPIQEEYNNQTILQLQNAKRGDGSLQKIRPRNIVPWQDKMEYLRKAVDDSGYEIEYDYATDEHGNPTPYIKKIKNGAETIPNWEIWAKSALGDKFEEQDRMVAQVGLDRYRNHIKQQNPNIADKDVDSEIAKDIIPSYTDMIQNNMKTYESNLKTYDESINELKNQAVDKNGNPRKHTPQEQQVLSQYTLAKNNIKQLQEKLKQDNSEIYNRNRDAFIERLTNNPLQYFEDLQKNKDVANFAKGITALSSVTLENNNVWSAMLTDKREREIASAKIKEEHFGNIIKGMDAGVLDENGKFISTSTNPTPIVGKDTTDVLETSDPLANYQLQMNTLKGVAVDNVLSPTGVAKALTSRNIIPMTDLPNICTSVKKLADTPFEKLSNPDKENITKLQQKLKENNVPVGNTLPELIHGINIFTQNEAKRKDLTSVQKTNIESELTSALKAETALMQYNAKDKMLKNNTKTELATNPAFKDSMVYRNVNNPDDILHADTGQKMEKDKNGNIIFQGKTYEPSAKKIDDVVSDVDFVDGYGRHQFLSRREIVDAIKNNALQVDKSHFYSEGEGPTTHTPGTLQINNKEYVINDDVAEKLQKYQKQYNENYKDFEQKLSKSVLSKMPEYADNASSRYGTVQSYIKTDQPKTTEEKKTNRFVLNASQELALPGNQKTVYDSDKKPVDPETQKAIQEALASGNYTQSASYHNIGFNGKDLWEVKLDLADKKADLDPELTWGNVKRSDLYGKSFFIEVNPSTTSRLLRSYPKDVVSRQLFSDLYNGKNIPLSPTLSSHGFDLTMIPDQADPNNIIVSGSVSTRNRNTGSFDQNPIELIFPLIGDKAKTPQEIYDYLTQEGVNHIKNNNENLRQYNQKFSN